ncbi:MAG: hypothetical protein FMNOHCHN_03505 [Ignavibacteriaceae bacterium]|nr:hypothetical protein [Ignavibacteriaceae bacterium]
MNEELLIDLLEPFETDKFKKGMSKLPAAELERALIQIEDEIAKISGNIESLNITNPFDDEALFKLFFELYTKEETPLLQRAVGDYISKGIIKTKVLEPGEGFANLFLREREKVKPEGDEDNIQEKYLTYVNEIKNGNQRLRDSYNYYIKILLPLIETFRREHISKQVKDSDSQTSGIEPLDWKGSKTDLYVLLDSLIQFKFMEENRALFAKHFSCKGKQLTEKEVREGISKVRNTDSGERGSSKIKNLVKKITSLTESKSLEK